MRAAQLLAASVICLPILGGGCGRVTSKVGEYSAQSSDGAGTGTAASSSAAGAGSGAVGSSGDGANTSADAATTPMVVPSNDGACIFTPLDGAPRHPLDVYVMMDSNITLALGLWELASVGLNDFASDPASAGIGLGVRYYGNDCDRSAYAKPRVEVAPLPGNAGAIASSTLQSPFNASQMWPALLGAIDHQKERAAAHPKAKQVVALITDGYTQDFNIVCPIYQPDDVIAAARTGMSGSYPIETYVLEITTMLPVTQFADRFGRLDEVAAAGGTSAGIEIQATDATNGTHDALSEVRRRAQPCEYEVPGAVETSRLSLALASWGGGNPSELARVDTSDGCLNQDGWYFDDAAKPAYMRLCPTTCSKLRTDDTREVVPLTGCKPKTR